MYARSLLEGLLENNVCVTVYSGRSAELTLQDQPSDLMAVLSHHNVIQLMDVALPEEKWYRNDRESAWQQFADAVAYDWTECAKYGCLPAENVHAFVAVDFPATEAYARIASALGRDSVPPLVYLNFRVYANSDGISLADRAFYERVEGAAVNSAAVTVALSHHDAAALKAIAGKMAFDGHREPHIAVLLPALRSDIAVLAADEQRPRTRQYLTCCVRLSPEKDALLFVDAVAHLAKLGFFDAHPEITPLLCGAASVPSYAADVKRK